MDTNMTVPSRILWYVSYDTCSIHIKDGTTGKLVFIILSDYTPGTYTWG